MKQLSLDFDNTCLPEEAPSVVPATSLSAEDVDRAKRTARMMAVLQSFPPLEPNLKPADYMKQAAWFRRYLFSTEAYFFNRWCYWLDALAARRVPSEPIPQISFLSHLPVYSNGSWSESLKNYPGLKMLVDTMNFPKSYGLDLRDKALHFIDWLLTAVGSPRGEDLVKPDSEEAEWYYRKFQVNLLYEYPADYMSCFSVAIAGGAGNKLGHFPTPASVSDFMVQMLMVGENGKNKTASVLDPAAGTGILLLYASNFSLNLSAVEISPTLCKLLEAAGWLYMPWLVFPAEFHPDGALTPHGSQRIVTGNSLA
jgi:hypothetical protein